MEEDISSSKIAIIGLACRMPGAQNAQEFWQLIINGEIAIRKFDRSELLTSGLTPNIINSPDYVPALGYLEDADFFDADFFGLTSQEASLTDPQHRLFLQTAWHAFEDAGVDPLTTNARIGCFAGAGMSLYGGRRMLSYYSYNLLSNTELIDSLIAPQITIANKHDYLATKVAYKFNLTGPAISLNTACSTGLVAVHLACKSLIEGECDIAIAGAAAIPTPLKCGYRYEGGLLSPDGVCRPYDRKANGTVGGAGVGIVILKTLTKAVASNDRIRAVILGSAINNDGANKVSYLSPGVEGQIAVIKSALKVARVSPSSIGYIETHGTGTPHGDPIEFFSLSEAYNASSKTDRWHCALGAVKANIGHLDTAAGIAGLIKAVLVLEHGRIPKLTNLSEPNEALDLKNNAFYLPTSEEPWSTPNGNPRRAAVSAFGAGGTNAHLILQSYSPQITVSDEQNSLNVLTISAKTEGALWDLVRSYTNILSSPNQQWTKLALNSQNYTSSFLSSSGNHCIFSI